MRKRQAKTYSIVDHELLYGGYLARLTHKALALYLFLAVVGDSGGRSFYSPLSVGKILRMDPGELTQAREELIKERLIAYEQPYWRILTLTYPQDHGISTGMARMDSLVSGILKKSKEGAHD